MTKIKQLRILLNQLDLNDEEVQAILSSIHSPTKIPAKYQDEVRDKTKKSDERTHTNLDKKAYSISSLMNQFLDYAQYDCLDNEARQSSTVDKYRDCLRAVIKRIGDVDVRSINEQTIIKLKKKLSQNGVKEKRTAGIMNTLRVFIRYCESNLGLDVMDAGKIKAPKIIYLVPVYMDKDEVNQFIAAIKDSLKNKDGSTNIVALRFLALVHLQLATGARISEALGIKLNDIDFESMEINVQGKGGKGRIVYLTKTATRWICEYLDKRDSNSDYLFVINDGKSQLKLFDIWRFFDKYTKKAGLRKKITSHMLRRTFASTMMDNGADISVVSELLGHSDPSITLRHYIGPNQKRLKDTHEKFLDYNDVGDEE